MIRVENAVLKKLGIRKSSENYYFLLDMIELINQNGEKLYVMRNTYIEQLRKKEDVILLLLKGEFA